MLSHAPCDFVLIIDMRFQSIQSSNAEECCALKGENMPVDAYGSGEIGQCHEVEQHVRVHEATYQARPERLPVSEAGEAEYHAHSLSIEIGYQNAQRVRAQRHIVIDKAQCLARRM